MKAKSTRDLNRLKSEGEKLLHPKTIRIQVGTARCALAKGAQGVVDTLKKEIENQQVHASVVGRRAMKRTN